MSLKAPTVPYFFLQMFNRETAIGMLRQGNTGEQIINILDMIVSDVEQTNIQDFVDHAVALNTPTLQPIAF